MKTGTRDYQLRLSAAVVSQLRLLRPQLTSELLSVAERLEDADLSSILHFGLLPPRSIPHANYRAGRRCDLSERARARAEALGVSEQHLLRSLLTFYVWVRAKSVQDFERAVRRERRLRCFAG